MNTKAYNQAKGYCRENTPVTFAHAGNRENGRGNFAGNFRNGENNNNFNSMNVEGYQVTKVTGGKGMSVSKSGRIQWLV